jgi:YegS/Rv2252/BmrU family lipid kinase
MKTLFVVNAAAGHGRGLARFERAARGLPKGDWSVEPTRGVGDGARAAREGLEQGFEAIVAVGGDGTVGEVLNGYMAAPQDLRVKACLGTWPAGSGCDLARHLGLRPDPATLAALLSTARPRALDAALVEFRGPDGAAERRWFLNVTSFGVAGEVARRMATSGKPLGGTLSYLLSSLGALLTTPPRDMELIADGQPLPRGRYHLVSLANTSTTGGGMKIAPGADAEDGKLDLVTVGDLPRARLLWSFPAVYLGRHLDLPGVSHRLVTRLEARSSEDVYLNIDGEAAGLLPAVFTALPRAVPFLLP